MCLSAVKKSNGFTLIQLVVALAIVAILAGLAFPSYKEAIRKGKRAEGRSALYQIMLQQEQFYSLRNSYIAFSSGSTGEDERQFKWFSGNSAATSAYEIKAEACEGETIRDCVRVTAIPGTAKVDSAYEDPLCGSLSFTSTGKKMPETPECWR